jgi:ATP-dependent Zn protease
VVQARRVELDQLVDLLLEHETIDGGEVYRIVGRPVPAAQRPEQLGIAPPG